MQISAVQCVFGILIFGGSTVTGQLTNGLKELQTSVGKGLDIVKDAANFTPTIGEIGAQSKDLLFGLAPNVILETLNKYCSLAMATEGDAERSEEVIPELANLGLILLDNKYNKTFTIDQVDEMINFETFNKNNPTVILTTGWLSMTDNQTNGARERIYDAYLCRGNTNFILFDSENYITTIYLWSARNTETLGKFLAKFLAKMTETIPVEKFHLIGHSLGAQISGQAGRSFQDLTNKRLPRITGLDAARPCFNEGELLNGLGRGDADFVDAIHTNNGALGQKLPIGDADFFPNGMLVLQPGCVSISCAHSRAYELYAETVYLGAEKTFMATRCNSMYSYNRAMCKSNPVPMGFATPKDTKGNFFLKTEAQSPYGEAKITSCGTVGSSGSVQTDSTTSTTTTEKSKILGVFG